MSPSANAASELLELDRRHVWHPYSGVDGRLPVFPVRAAQGVELELADGRRLLDGMSSWWTAIHGYNHPVLNQAVQDQLGQMAHVMLGGLTHPEAVRLCETLARITPGNLQRVFLSDSGSVAVEVAIKMALQYWQSRGQDGKHRVLSLAGGYHGDTFMAMSVCDPDTGMHHLFTDNLHKQLFAPRPRCRFAEDCTGIHTAELEQLFARHHHELAAMIVEPIVQGAGGMWFYSPGYLARVRELCDQHQVLLIADEIATGFGRCGKLFACEYADISPDILCLGKALTGGYMSMAATLCTEAVAEVVCSGEAGVFMHGPTFMGNPLACAVANASIELLLSQPWQRNIERIEASLQAGLAPAADLPGVKEVRVLGAIGVIEMRARVDMARLQPALVDAGIWLRPFGKLVYTMPPYVISDSDLSRLCTALMTVLARTSGAD